jgi:hypothetical protein
VILYIYTLYYCNIAINIFNYSNYRRDEQFNSIEVIYIDRFENFLSLGKGSYSLDSNAGEVGSGAVGKLNASLDSFLSAIDSCSHDKDRTQVI